MKIKKITLSFIFALSFLSNAVFLTPYAQAGYWGEPIYSTFIKDMLEKIARQIEGALLGAVKASAISMINSQVGKLVGGSSAGTSLVINDWKQFLYDEPEKKVQMQMEGFFASATKGRGASANYSASGGINGNYSAQLIKTAKSSLSSSSSRPADILDVSSDPEASLAEGDLRTLNALFSNPMNNPFGFALAAQGYEQSIREQAQQEQVVQAISHGYRSAPGLPGATVGQLVANAQDVGNKIIAAASNPQELASGIVMSLVNKTITNVVQKGIGEVQTNIQREIGTVNTQVTGQLETLDAQLGPGAGFVNEVRQQSNVNVKPATNPGAAVPRGISI